MLGHYLSVAFRNLRGSPVATAVNVITLALGLACFLCSYAFVTFWRSAEEGFANADRTAVLTISMSLSDGTFSFTDDTGTPEAAAAYLKTDYPAIERVARAVDIGTDAMLASGDRAVRAKVVAVDPEFTEIFDLPFLAGAPSALRATRSAVVSRSLAARLFGDADPIGRRVVVENAVEATVAGVIGEIPEPSHMGRSSAASLPFDILVSWDVHERIREAQRPPGAPPPPENFLAGSNFTYVLLPPDGSLTLEALRAGLGGFAARHVPESMSTFARVSFGAIPVRAALGNSVDGAVFVFGGGLSISTVLISLGALVLVVACVNYANLATARATRRVREVGLRKALGARPAQILAQHLFEAALLTALALACALLGFLALEPIFSQLMGVSLGSVVLPRPAFWLSILGVAAVATLAAGAYPAFVVARVKPLHALRASLARLGPKPLSTLLVGGQFAVASFLLIAVTIATLQNRQLLRTGLGTAEDPLVLIDNPSEMTKVDANTLRDELVRVPQVKGVTGLVNFPWRYLSLTRVSTSPGADAIAKTVLNYGVGYDFFALFDVPVLAGTVFRPERSATDVPGSDKDSTVKEPRAIVVDRAFTQEFGFISPASAIDQIVYFPQKEMEVFGASAQALRIVGVVGNKPLTLFGPSAIKATLYQLETESRFQVARIDRNDVAGAIEGIDTAWRGLAPNVAISRRFVNDIFQEVYSTFTRLSAVVSGLAVIAFLICVSGLFGIATLVANRRLAEIGVRKTLGASGLRMVAMLLRGFSVPVVVANLVAWPFAYWTARAYLDQLLAPIPITIWPFVLSTVATLGIASLAVGGQTLRAAYARPADVLRHE